MEAILFIGIQGSGKSSFYKQRFFSSHVRISLDLLRTRNREKRFLDVCLATNQQFVIDNTNPTRVERVKYLAAAKAAGYSVIGYYFQSISEECLSRNVGRIESEQVPTVAIRSTSKKLELPVWEEGFDELFYVRMQEGQFIVEEWRDEV